jgi:hypothetical protein
MTELTDAFRGYANTPQNWCIVTVQSKAKLICSGLTVRKRQTHDCENLKRILAGRKYICSDTDCCTADVAEPTLLSAAACRTEFRHFPVTPRKAEKSTHQVWLCKINSNTRFVCLFVCFGRDSRPRGP